MPKTIWDVFKYIGKGIEGLGGVESHWIWYHRRVEESQEWEKIEGIKMKANWDHVSWGPKDYFVLTFLSHLHLHVLFIIAILRLFKSPYHFSPKVLLKWHVRQIVSLCRPFFLSLCWLPRPPPPTAFKKEYDPVTSAEESRILMRHGLHFLTGESLSFRVRQPGIICYCVRKLLCLFKFQFLHL